MTLYRLLDRMARDLDVDARDLLLAIPVGAVIAVALWMLVITVGAVYEPSPS